MAKKQPVAPVVAPEPQIDVVDTALQVGATTEVRTLGSFLTNLGGFLTTARHMETRALDTLDTAKLLVKPTSKEEDEAIVATVRLWNAEANELSAHWDARNVVFTLHKRLIAAFQRAETPQKAAIEMATRLHNAYVTDEQARVRREEQERREAEEARQRELRAAELKKLEDEALAAEANSPTLSERETQFAGMVARGMDVVMAARAAGYKNPVEMADRLIHAQKIVDALALAHRAAELRKQAAAVIAKPVVLEDVTVVAEVAKAADRTTQRAEVFDEAEFIAACLAPGNPYGIPGTSLLTVKQAALTEKARQMGDAFNRWPGVRLASNTRIR